MKYCINCGKEINETAKFCPFCGQDQTIAVEPTVEVESTNLSESSGMDHLESAETTSQQQNDTTELNHEINQQESTSQQQVNPEQQAQTNSQQEIPSSTQQVKEKVAEISQNEKVQEIAKHSKNYLSFLTKNSLSPQLGALNNHSYFGLINYIIISVVGGLAFSRMASNVIQAINPFLYDYSDVSTSSFPAVIQLILYFAVINIIYVVCYFGLASGIYKQKMSFIDAFDRIFTPSSISVYLTVLSFILSLIPGSPISIFLLLMVVSLSLVNFSFIGNVWVAKDFGKHNRFYFSVLTYFVYSVILMIIFRIILNSLLENSGLQDLLYYLY